MNNSNTGTSAASPKKKKSGRFNFIDFILLVIVILIFATVLYVFAPFSWIKNLSSDQTQNIQYTVEILGVNEEFIDKIQENDTVIDSVSKNHLGTVDAVDYNNKYTELEYIKNDTQMEGVLAEYPHQYNIIITISATADYTEGIGYSINNCRIAVGEKMALRFPDYVGEGYCIGVNAS